MHGERRKTTQALEIGRVFSSSCMRAARFPGAPMYGRRRVSGAFRIHVAQKEDVAMRTYDLAPLWRSTIGFDHLFDLLDQSMRLSPEDSYPPYNIERLGENEYQIALALAGFGAEDVTITAEQNVLTVEGRKAAKGEHDYLYHGISARPFRRTFNLADYVQVKGASFVDGLLKIDLVRDVPEAMKPRRIPIRGADENKIIEHKKAA